MKRIDYTGQRFGKLIIMKMLYNYQNKGKTYAQCKCDCGNEKDILMSNIKKGLTQSCGCWEKESRYLRKHNKDLKGMCFGKLIAVKEMDVTKEGHKKWLCECECGNNRIVTANQLILHRVTSCGCDNYNGLVRDLTGQIFGMLTVLSPTTRKSKHKRAWKCKCECGNIVIVNTSDLVSQNSQSCGCKHASLNERLISDILKNENIMFKTQYKFQDCKNIKPLPFDFYLPEYNTLIEYDGEQHYRPVEFWGGEEGFQKRQQNDFIKSSFCEKNDIKLIRIPYTLSREEIHKIIISIKNPVTTTVA